MIAARAGVKEDGAPPGASHMMSAGGRGLGGDSMKNGWTGCDTIYFTAADVMSLQTAIKADPLYSNWASTAVHNG